MANDAFMTMLVALEKLATAPAAEADEDLPFAEEIPDPPPGLRPSAPAGIVAGTFPEHPAG